MPLVHAEKDHKVRNIGIPISHDGHATLPAMNTVNIELDDTDASRIAEVMMHLAALIDPDDPDGLRDAFGRRNEGLERHLLTNGQFVMLRHPAYREDERADVAEDLCA